MRKDETIRESMSSVAETAIDEAMSKCSHSLKELFMKSLTEVYSGNGNAQGNTNIVRA
jgi:hypothetical protein